MKNRSLLLVTGSFGVALLTAALALAVQPPAARVTRHVFLPVADALEITALVDVTVQEGISRLRVRLTRLTTRTSRFGKGSCRCARRPGPGGGGGWGSHPRACTWR